MEILAMIYMIIGTIFIMYFAYKRVRSRNLTYKSRNRRMNTTLKSTFIPYMKVKSVVSEH